MLNPSKKRIVVIALVALAVTTAINVYHIRQQQEEQEKAVRLKELSKKMLAKAAVALKLNKAEEQLMSGNYDESFPVIRKLAEEGNVRSLHDMGWVYRQGIGVEKDYAQALSWLTRAAEVNEAPDSYSASFYIGEIYYKGLGAVKADREKAIKWLKRAREHGVKEAAQYLQEGDG